jgi:hypothetical protein
MQNPSPALSAIRGMPNNRLRVRVNFFIAKTSYEYTMNYLHQEKGLRDHEACRPLIVLVDPLWGAIALPGLSLTLWNPRPGFA